MTYKLALIPARGGSKRLPDKNIKELNGKPLIAWTIEAALESGLFNQVVVSTDSLKIADIARRYGAEVPFMRPDVLSGDHATTSDVVKHAVTFIENNKNVSIDVVCLLQPTSPLRTSEHIQKAFELYSQKDAKSVISVCRVEHPIQLCNKLDHGLSMCGFISLKDNKRGQDHELYYRLNGAIYIFGSDHFNDISHIYDLNSYAYIMDRRSSIDIDEKEDFIIAEVFMKSI